MKAVDEHARVTGIWCRYVGQEEFWVMDSVLGALQGSWVE